MTEAQFNLIAKGLNTLGTNDQKLFSKLLTLEKKMDDILAGITDLQATAKKLVADSANTQTVDPTKKAAILAGIADVKTSLTQLDAKFAAAPPA